MMVACAFDWRSPGKPNAHFNFNFGTSAAVRPALFASAKRVFDVFAPPQPFHVVTVGSNGFDFSDDGHIARGSGVISRELRSFLPVSASAMARRSAALRPVTIDIIGPVSIAARTRSADIARSASISGAPLTPPMWHCVHVRWKRALPSGGCSGVWANAADADAASTITSATLDLPLGMRRRVA